MRKRVLVATAVAGSFLLGFLISGAVDESGRGGAGPEIDLPAAATQAWFPPIGDYDTGGEPLDDERFEALLSTLDEALTADETLADFEREAPIHLWNFIRRLAVPRVTEEQNERVSAFLEGFAAQHPDHRAVIESNMAALERYGHASPTVPAFSSKVSNFGYREWFDSEGAPFSDAQVDGMLGSLDAMLGLPETRADYGTESRLHFTLLANRLQKGQVSEEQYARVVAYFDQVEARHPEFGETIAEYRLRVASFTPGRVAPNIVGTDTEGVEFALEDYRGNIVVLIFSGEWCGPCIGEYPFHHFILEQFEGQPVALLGINSDADVETIRRAKATGKAPSYRTWWDGHGEKATSGPIASAWNVTGWPAIYVLDEEGVIRTVGDRGGHLIATVGDLLTERRMRELANSDAVQVETIPAFRTMPAKPPE